MQRQGAEGEFSSLPSRATYFAFFQVYEPVTFALLPNKDCILSPGYICTLSIPIDNANPPKLNPGMEWKSQ